jgi:plastocyanin
MTGTTIAIALSGVMAPFMLASAAALTIVTQAHRAFSVRELSISRGDVVRFSNADEFLHHVYVKSPAFSFNSGEQEPGSNIDVAFPVPGSFEVRCEIHPKMLLKVSVK